MVHGATTEPDWAEDVARGRRFEFGANWLRFLELLDENRIRMAEESLKEKLGVEGLANKTFLDIGSGSGLFSLAARRLGARVHSFDYDPQSCVSTAELRNRYFPDDNAWVIERGSALDRSYLEAIGKFDVVYSWGVLHHTGRMWTALDNAAVPVAEGGQLFVAIYNDQGRATRRWTTVKKAYVKLPRRLKWIVLAPAFIRLWGPTLARDAIKGQPLRTWRSYSDQSARGMAPWRDVVDWVGGYPFEVASPEELLRFYRERGFELTELATCGGGLGCNEFVFRKRS